MARFADMTPNARLGWLLWAREHDWGRRAVMSDDGKLSGLACLVTRRDGTTETERPIFETPREMKAWAGY